MYSVRYIVQTFLRVHSVQAGMRASFGYTYMQLPFLQTLQSLSLPPALPSCPLAPLSPSTVNRVMPTLLLTLHVSIGVDGSPVTSGDSMTVTDNIITILSVQRTGATVETTAVQPTLVGVLSSTSTSLSLMQVRGRAEATAT